MSKVCPSCKEVVEDEERLFCPYCGNPFDSNLKLTMDVDRMVRNQKTSQSSERKKETSSKTTISRYDDDDYIPPLKSEEKKSNLPIIIIIMLIIVLCVCAVMYLK